MSTAYAGDPDNTPTTIAIPGDDDARNAASVGTPIEGAFDWIKHLDRDKLETSAVEDAETTRALANAALNWQYPGVTTGLTGCTLVDGAFCPFAGTGNMGAFVGIDGGANHQTVLSFNGRAWSADADLDSSFTVGGPLFAIAASTQADVFVALGAGASDTDSYARTAGVWTQNLVVVAGYDLEAIAYDEFNDSFVAVGAAGSDFAAAITYNGGTSYDDVNFATAIDIPTMIAINRTGICIAAVGTSSTYWRSTDGGQNWTELAAGLGAAPAAITCDYHTGLFWAISGVGGLRSSPDGLNWTVHSSGPIAPNTPRAFAVHRGVLVASASTNFRTRVSINGSDWAKVAGPTVAAPSFVRYGGGRFWQGGASGANGVGSASHAAMLIGGF